MSFRVRASVAAGYIARLEGTADLEKADAAVMQIEASGGDAVDYRALTIWLAHPNTARRLSRVCSDFLAQEDIYLVTEAFRISKADYRLVDRDGAKLAVTGAAFGQVDPSSSSTLSVTDDLYFGVRGVKALAPGLSEPGREPRTVPDADGLLHLMEP
jgi:hypothetical protein